MVKADDFATAVRGAFYAAGVSVKRENASCWSRRSCRRLLVLLPNPPGEAHELKDLLEAQC